MNNLTISVSAANAGVYNLSFWLAQDKSGGYWPSVAGSNTPMDTGVKLHVTDTNGNTTDTVGDVGTLKFDTTRFYHENMSLNLKQGANTITFSGTTIPGNVPFGTGDKTPAPGRNLVLDDFSISRTPVVANAGFEDHTLDGWTASANAIHPAGDGSYSLSLPYNTYINGLDVTYSPVNLTAARSIYTLSNSSVGAAFDLEADTGSDKSYPIDLAPEGNRVAYLEDGASISQTLANWQPGAYYVSYQAQQGVAGGNGTITISVDGNTVDTLTPIVSANIVPFQDVHSVVFPITGPGTTHTLKFSVSNGTVFLDNIQVNSAPPVINLSAAAVSTTEVDLSWQVQASGSSSTEIIRALSDGFGNPTGGWEVVGALSPTATSFQDLTAQPGLSYLYQAMSANVGGVPFPPSNIAGAETPALTAPQPSGDGSTSPPPGYPGGPSLPGGNSGQEYYQVSLSMGGGGGDAGLWTAALATNTFVIMASSPQQAAQKASSGSVTFALNDDSGKPIVTRQLSDFTRAGFDGFKATADGTPGNWLGSFTYAVPEDGEQDAIGVSATITPWYFDVSDVSKPANKVSSNDKAKVLYVPETTSGNAIVQIKGNNLVGTKFSVTGNNATPSSDAMSSNEENITLTPTGGNDDFMLTVGNAAPIHVHVIEPVLDVKTIQDNKPGVDLPASQKTTTGAFVPVDDGDANYNQIPDYQEATPPTDDHRLLPIVLKGTGGASSATDFFTIQIDALTDVRVFWQGSADTALHLVDSTTHLRSSLDWTLYVQGIGGVQGGEDVNVDLHTNGVVYKKIDSLFVTTFEMSGALNVPGNGIYEYKAINSFNDPSLPVGSHWVAPSAGTIQSGANTNDVTIQWSNSNAVVGEVPFNVNQYYQWDVDVNVVKIDVSTPANAFVPGRLDQAGFAVLHSPAANTPIPITVIESSDSKDPNRKPGLTWNATVTMTGANGGIGVSQINVGFIQQLVGYQSDGHYQSNNSLKSNMDNLALPILDATKQGNIWYFGTPSLSDETPDTVTGVFSDVITSNDSPQNGPPMAFDTTLPFAKWDKLNSIKLDQKFQLFICVTTKDIQNNSDQRYTEEAVANWEINGDGKISQNGDGVWQPDAEAGIFPPSGWLPISSGEQPNITGDVANTLSQTKQSYH